MPLHVEDESSARFRRAACHATHDDDAARIGVATLP